MATINTGMEKADMKKALLRAKDGPINVALGMGDNSATALLVMSHKGTPRATGNDLEKAFPNVKNPRFGTAFVDANENPAMLQVRLNRPVSGMAKRLVKTLKSTGITKVRLLTEDGSVMEELEEADEEAALEGASGAADATSATAAGPEAADKGPAAATAAPPPPAGAAAPQAPQDKAAQAAILSKRLAAMIADIPAAAGADAARKEALGKMAREAGVNIKVGNLTYAANALLQLEKALAIPAPPPPPPGGTTPEAKAAAVAALTTQLAAMMTRIPAAAGQDAGRRKELEALAKQIGIGLKFGNIGDAGKLLLQLKQSLAAPAAATEAAPAAAPETAAAAAGTAAGTLDASRKAWSGVRQQVTTDVEKLRAALAAAYDGQPFASEILTKFGTVVAPVLAQFDGRVEAALDGVLNEADPAKREARLAEARAVVEECESFASNKLIDDLDGNPFVPLGIRGAATAGLAAVSKAIQ